jgi:hypothetical protein
MYEGSDMCESVEYGRTYIEIASQYTKQFRSRA